MIELDRNTSIQNEVLPQVRLEVAAKGYSLITLEDPPGETELLPIIVLAGSLVGRGFGERVTVRLLDGTGDARNLHVHTESIYATEGICRTFALGCIRPSGSGGRTRIYDAKEAAIRLSRDWPEIADIRIRYTTGAHPHEVAEYPLVVDEPGLGSVLRYRSPAHTNAMLPRSGGLSEAEVYDVVESVLTDCIVLDHAWSTGQLLFVDNRITLHDRTAYSGRRIMVRLRFDDPGDTSLTF